jgi:hypothetical protein
MDNPRDIAGILVTFFVDDQQALFIMLSSDGAINRMGTGSLVNAENDLFIGKTSLPIFESLKKLIDPNLLQWFNRQNADRAPKGKICKLTLGVKQRDGKELMSSWQYGSESLSPPSDITAFALRAIELTNPWYEEQKKIAKA